MYAQDCNESIAKPSSNPPPIVVGSYVAWLEIFVARHPVFEVDYERRTRRLNDQLIYESRATLSVGGVRTKGTDWASAFTERAADERAAELVSKDVRCFDVGRTFALSCQVQNSDSRSPKISSATSLAAERVAWVRERAPLGIQITQITPSHSTGFRVAVRPWPSDLNRPIGQWRSICARAGIPISVVKELPWTERTGLPPEEDGSLILRGWAQIDSAIGQRRGGLQSPPSSLPAYYRNYIDRRNRDVISIDPPGSKDVDDAISIGPRAERPLPPGQTWVGVHIAAVTEFIFPDSHEEKAALTEGVASYGRTHVKPIFPPNIAFDLASLRSSVDRLAYTFFFRINEHDEIVEIDLKPERSLIRNQTRYRYRDVDEILRGTRFDLRAANFYRLASIAAKAQAIRGNQNPFRHRGPSVSENIISEFMILTNVASAYFLQRAGVPFLSLVNSKPPRAIATEGDASFADWLKSSLAANAGAIDFDFGDWAEAPAHSAADHPRAMASAYSVTSGGHWNLRTPVYGHFTSPLRRASDYLNQRQLANTINGTPTLSRERLEELTESINLAVRRSRRAKANRMIALEQLKSTLESVGQRRQVAITAIFNGEVFLSGDRHFPLGYLETSTGINWRDSSFLPMPAWQILDDGEFIRDWIGRDYRPGDVVDVLVSGVDLVRERILYRIP